jgi:hypothetical protein
LFTPTPSGLNNAEGRDEQGRFESEGGELSEGGSSKKK